MITLKTMGLEKILTGLKSFKRKLITSTIISSSLIGCSGSQENPIQPRPPPPPPVQTPNRAPIINSNPLIQIGENSLYEYGVQATDPDGDPLSYSIEGPDWLSVSHNTVYGNSPEVLQNTGFPIKIKVSDGKLSTEQNYNLNVKNLFNLYAVSSSSTNPLTDVQENSLTFSQPVDFIVGDILGAGISNKTPYGVLREITSISSNKTKVNTKQATLEKIIRQGYFSFSGTLSQSNVQSFTAMREGVSPAPHSAAQSLKFGLSFTNVVLYDFDGKPSTKDDQLIANGKIELDTDFDFSADIRGIRLNSLDFRNISSVTSDITLGSNVLGIASRKEILLGGKEYYFSPIVIPPSPAVPLPIVVVPKVGVYVGINPTNVNPLSVRVKQNASLETRLRYDGSWNPFAAFSNNFDFSNPVFKGEWDLGVYVSPRLTLLFGGVLGTATGVSANLRLEASQAGDWKLYGGLGAGIGVSMEIFTKGIAAYYKNVIESEKVLAQGVITPPQPVKTDTLRAGKDAYIAWSNIPNSAFPNTNYNTTSLKLKRDEGRSYEETMIQFPINSLPTGAIINSAKIIMYGYCVNNSTNPSVNLDLRKIIGNWGESSVTWNSKPGYSSKTYSSLVAPVKANFRAEKDITSLTQEWSSDRNQNYGAALIIDENIASCSLDSRESSDLNKRPMLIISYH